MKLTWKLELEFGIRLGIPRGRSQRQIRKGIKINCRVSIGLECDSRREALVNNDDGYSTALCSVNLSLNNARNAYQEIP